MAKYDDLDTKQIFIIGIASVMVTLVTILAVQYVYFLLVNNHQDLLQAQSSYRRQNEALAEQSGTISQYGADPETANVVIPVREAMKLVAKDYQQQNQTDSDDNATNDAENDQT